MMLYVQSETAHIITGSLTSVTKKSQVYGVRQLLTQVMTSPSLILSVLKEICKPAATSPDRAKKKAKLDEYAFLPLLS
jgi:hypothetical protein